MATFIAGIFVGIVLVVVALPLFSKYIMKFAMKRQMNNLVGSVKSAASKFENIIEGSVKEENNEQCQEKGN